MKDISIKNKLLILSLSGVFGLFCIIMIKCFFEYGDQIATKERLLSAAVDSPSSVLHHYGELEASGKMSREDAQKEALFVIKSMRYQDKEYFWINDTEAKMVMHPVKSELDGKDMSDFKDPDGKKIFVEFASIAKTKGDGYYDYKWPKPGMTDPVDKKSYVRLYKPWGWVVGSGVYIDDVKSEIKDRIIVYAVIALIAGFLSFLFSTYISRQISKPVIDLKNKIDDIIRTRNLNNLINLDRKDEIGAISKSIDVLISDFRGITQSINDAAHQIKVSSMHLSQASELLVDAAQQQSTSAMSTSAAVEEMSTSIAHVAENAKRTEDIVSNSESMSVQGADVVRLAVSEMNKIAESVSNSSSFIFTLDERSSEIKSIINIISEIYEQTNLLALNAAIEAARAGEQGRGFAVVADEVRKLAERTKRSAQEIEGKIETINLETHRAVSSMKEGEKRVEDGVEIANRALLAMEEIRVGSEAIREAVEDISRSISEQNSASAQIANDICNISTISNDNAVKVADLMQSAQMLDYLAEGLKKKVELYTA